MEKRPKMGSETSVTSRDALEGEKTDYGAIESYGSLTIVPEYMHEPVSIDASSRSIHLPRPKKKYSAIRLARSDRLYRSIDDGYEDNVERSALRNKLNPEKPTRTHRKNGWFFFSEKKTHISPVRRSIPSASIL